MFDFFRGKRSEPAIDCIISLTLPRCTRFSIEARIDNINLFKILRYFEKSKILQKLHG